MKTRNKIVYEEIAIDEKECMICLTEGSNLTKAQCGHECCINCWKKIILLNNDVCFMCREPIKNLEMKTSEKSLKKLEEIKIKTKNLKDINSKIQMKIQKEIQQREIFVNIMEKDLYEYMNIKIDEFINTDIHFLQNHKHVFFYDGFEEIYDNKYGYMYCIECVKRDAEEYKNEEFLSLHYFDLNEREYDIISFSNSTNLQTFGNLNYIIKKLFSNDEILKNFYDTSKITNNLLQNREIKYFRRNLIPDQV